MTRKRQRLGLLALGLAALGGATAMVLVAFNDNIVFFYSPTELKQKAIAADRRVRVGGLVELHSVARNGDRIVFRVTDGKTDLPVSYTGVLPDLFREGQGVVAEGRLGAGGGFVATTILAKHDERYMPPEVVAALKKSGHWQEGAAAAPPPLLPPASPLPSAPLAGQGAIKASGR
jgi:cytochrome c-type biogenesis protein CcmE